MAGTDWARWHDGYRDPGSMLGRRLVVVQRLIREFLDSRPLRDLRVVSICAGDGRDLLGVLAGDPSPGRVSARLVELDAGLAERGRARALADDLERVEVVTGDASLTAAYAGAVPADLVLVCGVFGNISEDNVRRTVGALPGLCAERGVVIWTRHRRSPDLTPSIRWWLSDAGFVELAFESPGADSYSVGMHELRRPPDAFSAAGRLFVFGA